MKKNKSSKKVGGIVRRVILAVIAVVIGINIYSFNAEALAGNRMPMPFGVGSAFVLSGSMEPALMINDLLIVTDADSYEVGDIVVYQLHSDLIVHRIIEIDGDMVTTKGDANPSADNPIKLRDIKGRVAIRIPFVGVIVRLLKTPAAVFAMIAAAVVLLIVSFDREKKIEDEEITLLREELELLKQESSANNSDDKENTDNSQDE